MRFLDRDGNPLTVEEWRDKMREPGATRVAHSRVGRARVSTIWLGLDHSHGDGPPLVFETMIFGGPHDEWMLRYTTLDQAVAGHKEVVRRLKRGIEP